MRRLALLVLASALAAAACSSGPEVWGEERRADQLVLQVDDDGGFTTLDYMLAFPPRYSIYADGTIYFRGAGTPGFLPLLKTITSAQLDDAQLVHLASLVDDIGLPEVTDNLDGSLLPGSGGESWVIDGATTTATYFDRDGGTHSYGVYALGRSHEAPESKALWTLVADLSNMTAAATNLVDLPAERLQLHWRRERPFNAAAAAEALPWPLTIAPQDFVEGRDREPWCAVLTGEDALEAAEKLATVQWESRFVHGERGYRLIGRVLLPGEEGCIPS